MAGRGLRKQFGLARASDDHAHVLIAMIAAAAHALNGDAGRAADWAANVRERNGTLTRDDFCSAFPMKSDAMRVRVLQALRRLGF